MIERGKGGSGISDKEAAARACAFLFAVEGWSYRRIADYAELSLKDTVRAVTWGMNLREITAARRAMRRFCGRALID